MNEKADPIVPSVLYVAEQHHPWQLAPIGRLTVKYHTATTVFLDFGSIDLSVRPVAGRNGVSKQHYHVWCLVDDAAWERVQAERAAFQATIDELAARLRGLGRYADRLAEAGGVARAPNPLAPTVINAPELDVTPKNWHTTNPVPQLTRRVAISHTAKMLRCQASYNPETEVPHHQRDYVVCPTDADWEGVLALHQAALAAEQCWNELLSELGTYRDALVDRRSADRVVEQHAVEPLVAERTEDAPEPLGAPAPQPQLEGAAPQLVLLSPIAIRTDGGTQSRAELHQQTVDEYAEAMTAGARFPAVITYYDGETYWLADGFHRLAAARHLRVLVQAEVRQGTRRDAVLEACGANAHHGLRRTNADKRRAVETLLRDEEWRQWSDREIARRAGVHHELVGRLRSELGLTGGIRQSGDGRQIDTSGIGRANAARAETREAAQQTEQQPAPATAPSSPRLGPGQPEPAPWPDPPEGWRWNRRGAPAHLVEPDGWKTHNYNDPERALAEAQQHIFNQPKTPPPAPLTPEVRDADGPWFWASKSAAHPTAHHWRARPTERGRYVSACGLEVESLPTTGALAGHCSVCERHAGRRETIPIPVPAGVEPAPDETPMTDAGRVEALRDYLEQQRRAGLLHRSETADTAWKMASDIHDGDTYRMMACEIREATDREAQSPASLIVAAHLEIAAEPPSNADTIILSEESIEPPAGSGTQIEVASSSPGEVAPTSISIGVYAPAVTLLTAIRTALLTNQRGQALSQALALVRVLADGLGEAAELDDATHAALAAYRQARAAVRGGGSAS